MGKVGGPVELFLGSDDLAGVVGVAVDEGSDAGQLGDAIHGVFKGELPVIFLVHTIAIGLGKLGVLLQGHDADRKGCHRVHCLGKRKDEVLDPRGDVRARRPLRAQALDLCGRRDFTGEEQPEHAFRQGLAAGLGGGKKLLAFGDGIASEADALLGVEQRSLSDHGKHAAHASVGLVHSASSHDNIFVLFKTCLLIRLKLGDDSSEALVQRGLRGKASGTKDTGKT